MAGTRFRRVREVVILKTLGATRRSAGRIFSVEFLTLGVVAGLMGALLASVFSRLLLNRLLDAKFAFDWSATLVAMVLTAAARASLRLARQLPHSAPKAARSAARRVASEIFRPQTGIFRDLRESRRPDLLAIVKAKCKIARARLLQLSMRADLRFERSSPGGEERRTLAWPWWRARCSSCEQGLQRLRNLVATFDHVSQYLEGYRLSFAHCGIFGIAHKPSRREDRVTDARKRPSSSRSISMRSGSDRNHNCHLV